MINIIMNDLEDEIRKSYSEGHKVPSWDKAEMWRKIKRMSS